MDLQSGRDGVATLGDTASKFRLHGSGVIMRWSPARSQAKDGILLAGVIWANRPAPAKENESDPSEDFP